jgi:hypothetical protein
MGQTVVSQWFSTSSVQTGPVGDVMQRDPAEQSRPSRHATWHRPSEQASGAAQSEARVQEAPNIGGG